MHTQPAPRPEIPPNRIRELRESRDLKLYDISARLRIDTSTISRWETGESMVPDWAKLALAAMFEVEPAYLMGWEAAAA